MRVLIRTLDGQVLDRGIENGVWTDGGSGELLDLSDAWALPGLADSHAHLAQDEMVLEPGDPEAMVGRAFAALDHGVFLCVDKGWSDETVLGLFARPPTERPDLQAAGRMIAGFGGYFEGFAVETDDEGLGDVVRANLGTGGWVKLVGDWPRKGRGAVANFGAEAVRRAVSIAHAAGARVAIHTMAPEVPTMAVAAGVDSIEHGLYLTDDDVRALGSRGGAWVPTVLRMEAVIEELGPERTGAKVVAEGLDRVRALLGTAVEEGVAVLAGSDLAVPSAFVGREAQRLVHYGLSPDQAVASVSTAAHSYLGLGRSFDVGTPADLVAFAVHPHDDVGALLNPLAVVRHGQVRKADR